MSALSLRWWLFRWIPYFWEFFYLLKYNFKPLYYVRYFSTVLKLMLIYLWFYIKNLKPLGIFICLDFINLFKGMYEIWEITKVQVKRIKDQSKNRQEHANKGLKEKQAIEDHKWWALGKSGRITPTRHCHVKKIIRKLCFTVSFLSKWVSIPVKTSRDAPSTGIMIQQQFCLPQHPLLPSLIMAPVTFSLMVLPNHP